MIPYRWRVAKAERFLGDAEEALRAEMWETCISRCYYAAYHLVAALLESRGGYTRQEWRHERLAGTFEERFAGRGYLFSRRDAEIFRDLRRQRIRADYENARFTQRSSKRVLDEAASLCRRLLEGIENA